MDPRQSSSHPLPCFVPDACCWQRARTLVSSPLYYILRSNAPVGLIPPPALVEYQNCPVVIKTRDNFESKRSKTEKLNPDWLDFEDYHTFAQDIFSSDHKPVYAVFNLVDKTLPLARSPG